LGTEDEINVFDFDMIAAITVRSFCCWLLAFRIFVDTPGQDYHIGTAGKMSVDIDATPDLLLLIHHLRMDCRLL